MENKESIFTRFINFIKRVFGNEEPKQIPAETKVIQKQEPKSNFFDDLRISEEKVEDSPIIKLQNQFENGEMDLCFMSDEEIHNLSQLYKTQVADLKTKLKNKQQELNMLQKKLAS